MKVLFAVLAFLITQNLFSQVDFQITSARENFNKAYEHLAKEEYPAAFEYFDRINPSDSLYDVGQFNKIIAQYSGGFFKEVLKTCNRVINSESDYIPEAFYYKIKAQIDLRNYDSAHSNISFALSKYPLLFKYNYLEALMLKDQGKVEEAKMLLQMILKHHPKHAPSHTALAHIMGEEGGMSQAILGYQMAIISNRNSEVLRASFVGMEDITQNNIDIVREQKKSPLFKETNNLIVAKLALNKAYKAELPLNFFANNVTDLLFNNLPYKEGTGNFTMDYYVKYFSEVKSKGLTKGYVLYILSVINDSKTQKAIAKHKENYEAFIAFNKGYWTEYVNEHKFKVNKEVDERDYVTNENGRLIAFGNLNEAGENNGAWTFIYPNGQIAAESNYINGQLNGENLWFSPEGKRKESGVYKDGKLDGFAYFTHKNGCSKYDGEFTNDEINGIVKLYSESGILTTIKTIYKDKPDGYIETYYSNGKLASRVNTLDGKNNGLFYSFTPSGDTASVVKFQEGIKVGRQTEYHLNGNVKRTGRYSEGVMSGQWKDYFYNGVLKRKYHFKKGELDGEFVEFNLHGDTLTKKSYKNGFLHGVEKDYSIDNKVLWEHVYRYGTLKKYINYNQEGVVISKGRKEYVLNDRFGYKYIEASRNGYGFEGDYKVFWKNGQIKELKHFVNGVLHGPSFDYFKWGALDEKKFFKNGEIHGHFESYYDNGQLFCEGAYFEGKKIEGWKYYHPNGNLKETIYFANGISTGHVSIFAISGEQKANYFYQGNLLLKSEVFDQNGKVISKNKTPQGKGNYELTTVTGDLFIKTTLDAGEVHGKSQNFYPNGQISREVYMNHGEKHGAFEAYYPDGQPKRTGKFVFGNKEGEWKSYYHNGVLASKANYEHDMVIDSLVRYYITGELKTVEYFNSIGEKKSEKRFHVSGKLNYQISFEKEFKHGTVTSMDALGEVAICRNYNGGVEVSYSYMKGGKLIESVEIRNGLINTHYNNGSLAFEYRIFDNLYEGPYKKMYSNGKPWVETSYLNHMINGSYKTYYKNGVLQFDGGYKFGRLNGLKKTYNSSGVLLLEETFIEGVKEGEAKYYNNNGKLLYTLTYKDDVVVKVD